MLANPFNWCVRWLRQARVPLFSLGLRVLEVHVATGGGWLTRYRPREVRNSIYRYRKIHIDYRSKFLYRFISPILIIYGNTTNGYEMMHKGWSNIEEVPYCFWRSSIKFEGHTAKKSSILTKIGRFRTVTPVWIHWWLWNDTQSLKQHRRGALLFFEVICQISRSHGTKNCRFWPKLSVSGL